LQDAVEAGEPFVVAVSLQPIYSRSPRPIMVDFRWVALFSGGKWHVFLRPVLLWGGAGFYLLCFL
jgi:hypothetical protein